MACPAWLRRRTGGEPAARTASARRFGCHTGVVVDDDDGGDGGALDGPSPVRRVRSRWLAGASVAASVEPVSIGGARGAGWDRACAARLGEGRLGAEPVGVVASEDQAVTASSQCDHGLGVRRTRTLGASKTGRDQPCPTNPSELRAFRLAGSSASSGRRTARYAA
jgi:hypothetical protein